MCCGGKRSTIRPLPPLRTREPSPRDLQAPSSPPVVAETIDGLATLRYLREEAIRVVGPVTGRAYTFSGARPVQWVDPRDARMLGRSAIFSLG